MPSQDGSLPACVYEPGANRWHICKGDGDDKFQPILCNTVPELPGEVGINMPGNRSRRQPTCLECYRVWRLERDEPVAVPLGVACAACGSYPEHFVPKTEYDRAVETRENANAVSVRVEAENRRLREALEAALEWLPEPERTTIAEVLR